MKKYIPITIFGIILIGIICFYQIKILKLQEELKDSKVNNGMITAMEAIEEGMWRIRYLLLCDAIKKQNSDPKLLQAIKKNDNYSCPIMNKRIDSDMGWGDIKIPFSEPVILKYDLSDYLGLNDELYDTQIKPFLFEYVSFQKGKNKNEYIFTISPDKLLDIDRKNKIFREKTKGIKLEIELR